MTVEKPTNFFFSEQDVNQLSERPVPILAFVSLPKRLKVFFYTSSLAKFIQARVVFHKCGLVLDYFPSKTDPYQEDYSHGKIRLLYSAIEQVKKSIGEKSIFFVEDTSLRIEALSKGDNDFPGLAVKEWFSSASMKDANKRLLSNSGERRAIVKSDIALHIPGLRRPEYFHGETLGSIAETEPSFPPSPIHPWLTPNSFNGWFIPDGASRRLGEMTFEESWKYDFRIKALLEMIRRLEEYAVILNLSQQSYTLKESPTDSRTIPLFPPQQTALIIVGKTCAGKTTFGEYALNTHHLQYVEASSIVHLFERQTGQKAKDFFRFSMQLHKLKGFDIVAKHIIELYYDQMQKGFVITGLRMIEELLEIKRHFPHTKVILIEASERIRYHRHLVRAREKQPMTFDEFRRHDRLQWTLSLLKYSHQFCDISIANERDMQDYLQQIGFVLGADVSNRPHGVTLFKDQQKKIQRSWLFKSLLALFESDTTLDVRTLHEKLNLSETTIPLKRLVDLLQDNSELVKKSKSHYKLTTAGLAFVKLSSRNLW